MDKSLLVDIINQANSENLKMYFITRIIKEGSNSKSRVLEKFDFKVYQIEITSEVRKYLYDLSAKQFAKIEENEDLHFSDYDVIADDTEHLFTYQMHNKVGSFSDVVYNQLNQNPQKITDLNEILQDETLWAYCVEFEIAAINPFTHLEKSHLTKWVLKKIRMEKRKV